MADYYLGVDGGGTKTTAQVIDSQRRVIGKGEAAGSNWNVYGIDRSCGNLGIAIKKALANKKMGKLFGYLAMVGVNTEEETKLWQKAIKGDRFLSRIFSAPPTIVNDTQAALRAGTSNKNALVVISGTGSNCWGKNELGQEAKSGGVDYILSDEGSAYAVGSAILHSVVKALDGRGNQTVLKNLLFEKYKIDSLEKLILLVYSKHWDKVDIAKIAPLAQIAARGGDRVAQGILLYAADELALMARAVASKLNLLEKRLTVVKSGSVFKINKILNERFTTSILEFARHANIVEPKIDSVTAAALLAKEKKG